MTRRPALPFLLTVVLLCAGQHSLAAGENSSGLLTNFAVLVGFPGADMDGAGSELLVPGTVIPLTATADGDTDAVIERSLSYTKAVDKLWSTFRLDPKRRVQVGKLEVVAIGQALSLPPVPDSPVTITATLLSFDASTAAYRIVFREGPEGATMADSTVSVERGKRAVIGGMDGETAPYVFLFVEPVARPADEAAMRFQEDSGITEPRALAKVKPVYPEQARAEKITGVVVLDTLIDAKGRVTDVQVLRSPNELLTASAVESVSQWRFEPARKDGVAVAVRYVLTVQYSLK